jgi:hypothetical protein
MTRHLSLLALGGILGLFLMAGDAEACHKKTCGSAPVVCVKPVPPPCVKTTCAPRPKKCCLSGLFAGLGHKKSCAPAPAPCATPVVYARSYPAVAPSGQTWAAPQAAIPSYGTPQVPTK